MINNRRINRSFANRRGDFELEHEYRRHIAKCRHRHCGMRLHHTGRNDRRNGIRRIMKTVHEVEGKRQHDKEDNDAHTHIYMFHERAPIKNFRGRYLR